LRALIRALLAARGRSKPPKECSSVVLHGRLIKSNRYPTCPTCPTILGIQCYHPVGGTQMSINLAAVMTATLTAYWCWMTSVGSGICSPGFRQRKVTE
jgi:hypothetical protein